MPIFLAGETLPASKLAQMGVVAQFVSTANGSTLTGTTDTDMVLNNVPVIAGDLYAIHLHTRVDHTAAGGRWNAILNVNGSTVGTLAVSQNETALATVRQWDGTVYWTASVTQATDDFVVQAVETAGGTADIQLVASATAPRWLTITNVGRL